MAAITVFGGANMDILGMPQGALRLRDSNLGRVVLRAGGVGRNVAQHIAALGESCALMTAFGDDPLADVLRRDCESQGIDLSHALRAAGGTSVYLCLHDETGDMLAAVNDMAITAAMTVEYAAACLEEINRSRLCVLDTNPPAETLLYLAERAAVPLLLDPVSCAKLDRARAILPHLAGIKPNLMEARMLTGQSAPMDCAKALVAMGVGRAFVSLGGEGLCCADETMCRVLPVIRQSNAAKTGAGDALCAGLAVAMAHGMNTLECAQYGMQCAADFLQHGEDVL